MQADKQVINPKQWLSNAFYLPPRGGNGALFSQQGPWDSFLATKAAMDGQGIPTPTLQMTDEACSQLIRICVVGYYNFIGHKNYSQFYHDCHKQWGQARGWSNCWTKKGEGSDVRGSQSPLFYYKNTYNNSF
jgi:hypothetical protein